MYKLKRYKLWTHKKLLKNRYQNKYLSIIWSCQPKGVGSHLVYDSHRKLLQDLVEQVRYLLHKFSTTVTKVYKYQGPPYVVFQILRFRKNPDFAHFQGFQGAFMGISAWVPTRAGEIPKKFITPSQNEVYIQLWPCKAIKVKINHGNWFQFGSLF